MSEGVCVVHPWLEVSQYELYDSDGRTFYKGSKTASNVIIKNDFRASPF